MNYQQGDTVLLSPYVCPNEIKMFKFEYYAGIELQQFLGVIIFAGEEYLGEDSYYNPREIVVLLKPSNQILMTQFLESKKTIKINRIVLTERKNIVSNIKDVHSLSKLNNNKFLIY